MNLQGEIIGRKYGFTTRGTSYGATEMFDDSYWAKFTAFQALAKRAEKEPNTINSASQEENIFMRWKQTALRPRHSVPAIEDESCRGLYYVCLSLVKGQVRGYYFDGDGNV
jgi:hypothetical protein